MAFSIPQVIYPNFTQFETKRVNNTLNIGKSVKDMPSGAETTMKKANDAAIIQIKKQYEADLSQYGEDFKAAEIKSIHAENLIGNARKQKAIAITMFVGSIIALVGIVAASIVTQTWPILFAALPCATALIPASIYALIYSKKVNNLERDIAAPDNMKMPVLRIPSYYPAADLDLEHSRSDVQNAMSSLNLKQIFELRKSNDSIINYALLDRVALIKSENRPSFYSKCIQLISVYGQNLEEYNRCMNQASAEFKNLEGELQHWKLQQDNYIRSQERTLHEQELTQIHINAARRSGNPVPIRTSGIAGVMISKWQLDQRRSEVLEGYSQRNSQNYAWYQATKNNINATYNQATERLEREFTKAKEEAAS